MKDKRIEGIEIACLRVVDESLFVHGNYFTACLTHVEYAKLNLLSTSVCNKSNEELSSFAAFCVTAKSEECTKSIQMSLLPAPTLCAAQGLHGRLGLFTSKL